MILQSAGVTGLTAGLGGGIHRQRRCSAPGQSVVVVVPSSASSVAVGLRAAAAASGSVLSAIPGTTTRVTTDRLAVKDAIGSTGSVPLTPDSLSPQSSIDYVGSIDLCVSNIDRNLIHLVNLGL